MNSLHADRNPAVLPDPLTEEHSVFLCRTPFSLFREMWQCHFCGHEGHLVEPCLLPAVCTFTSDPCFLISITAHAWSIRFHSLRTGREVPNPTDFSSPIVSIEAQFLSSIPHPVDHAVSLSFSETPVPVLPSSTPSQHRDISLLPTSLE